MAKTKALVKTDKKILITGGTGFLGAHIVRQFLDAGEKNLRVMASRVPDWMKDAAEMIGERPANRLRAHSAPTRISGSGISAAKLLK